MVKWIIGGLIGLIVMIMVFTQIDPNLKTNSIPEDQIVLLVDKVTKIFMNQPVLLDLKAPIKICGILNFCFKLIK